MDSKHCFWKTKTYILKADMIVIKGIGGVIEFRGNYIRVKNSIQAI